MAKKITTTTKAAKTTKTAAPEKRKVGRPRKHPISINKYTSICVPEGCRDTLDDVRLDLAFVFGFGLSYGDTIQYLVKHYKDHKND
jgi:hypothetical protein